MPPQHPADPPGPAAPARPAEPAPPATRPGAATAMAPLRSPAFRRHLAGYLPSVTCAWAQVVALAWVVVQIDPRALGWVVALEFLPSLLLGPWFGAVADRYDRRVLLMVAEAGLGAVALGYAAAAAAGALTLPVVLTLAAAWGVVNALDTPARRALVPMLVPPGQTGGAAAITGVAMLLGMTAGSALGAVLVAATGPATAFAVNAAVFLADVVVLAGLRVGPSPRVPRAPGQVREGVRHVWRTPGLRSPMLTLAAVAAFTFTFPVTVPLLVRSGFGGDGPLIGAGFAAVTGGALVGAIAAGALGTPGPRTTARGSLALAAAMAATAAAPTLPLAMAALVGVGLTWSFLLTVVTAALLTAEPAMLGRVMALSGVVLLGGGAVGGPLAGTLATAVDPRAPYLLGALAAAAAWALARPAAARRPPRLLCSRWRAPSRPANPATAKAGSACAASPAGSGATRSPTSGPSPSR